METAQTAAASQKSRAQAIRDMVEIRIAEDGMGLMVVEILKENGIELAGADWSGALPNWLIATVDGHAIGCVQVLPSRPVGYLEFLFVRPAVPFKFRAIAIRKLMAQGFATLYLHGASYVGATVSSQNEKFANVIEKINAVKTFPGDMWVKRLT